MPPRFGGLPPGCDVQSRVPIAGLAGGTRATSILRPPLSSRRTTGGVLGARSERRVGARVVGRASYTASADPTIGFLDRRVAIPTGPLGIPLAWSASAMILSFGKARRYAGPMPRGTIPERGRAALPGGR